MANTCSGCGQTVYRVRWVPSKEQWLGIDCGCVRNLAMTTCANPFSDLTLEHVHGEDGKPIRVTSIHQLREAEKRYDFKHHVANMDEKNFNTAPSHRPRTVGDFYQRRFHRGHA